MKQHPWTGEAQRIAPERLEPCRFCVGHTEQNGLFHTTCSILVNKPGRPHRHVAFPPEDAKWGIEPQTPRGPIKLDPILLPRVVAIRPNKRIRCSTGYRVQLNAIHHDSCRV